MGTLRNTKKRNVYFFAVLSQQRLPLFALGSGSQISSFLTERTVSAFIDATSQKVVSGKIDWADVASNYLPVKGKFGSILSQQRFP